MCSHASTGTTHEIPHTKISHEIKGSVDCMSCNVIYKLTCKKCNNFLYIGETSRRASDRFSEHKSYITQKVMTQPAGEHFNSKGHLASDICIQVIEQVTPKDTFIRKSRESFWIKQYGAITRGNNSRL